MLKNIKELAKDTVLYGLSSILTQLAALFLVPYYTKELSPEEYGVVALFAMVSAFLTPLLSLGLDSALFRYFSMGRSSFLRLRLFSSAFLIKIIFVAFCVLLLSLCKGLVNEYVFENKVSDKLFTIFFCSLFLQNTFSLAYVILRVQRKVKTIVIVNIIALVVSLCTSIWLVLVLKLGVLGIMTAELIVSILKAALFIGMVKSNIRFNMFGVKKVKRLFSYGIPLIPHKIIGQCLSLFVLFLINNQLGLVVAGLFAVAKKFAKPISFLVSMIQTAWSPYKFDIHKNEKNPTVVFREMISTYWILLISFWSVLSLTLPILFRHLIDERYWGGIPYIPVLMLVSVFEAFKFTVSTGFELSNDQKQASIASLYSFLFVAVLLLLCFKYFQPYNFIILQILAHVFFGVYIYGEAKKSLEIEYPFKLIITYFIISSLVVMSGYLYNSIETVVIFVVVQIIAVITVFMRFFGINRIKKVLLIR